MLLNFRELQFNSLSLIAPFLEAATVSDAFGTWDEEADLILKGNVLYMGRTGHYIRMDIF